MTAREPHAPDVAGNGRAPAAPWSTPLPDDLPPWRAVSDGARRRPRADRFARHAEGRARAARDGRERARGS